MKRRICVEDTISLLLSYSCIYEIRVNNLVLEIEYIVIEILINYAKCCNIYIFIQL